MRFLLLLTYLCVITISSAKAEEIGFRFPQMPNLPREELDVIGRLEPWFKKIERSVQEKSEYEVFLNSFGNKRVRCKFKPIKGSPKVYLETIWSTGEPYKDSVMKKIVEEAISETQVPAEKLLYERGIDVTFTHSVKYAHLNGIGIQLADTYQE